jgi:hypothetical protein
MTRLQDRPAVKVSTSIDASIDVIRNLATDINLRSQLKDKFGRHPEAKETIIASRDDEQHLNMQAVVDGIKQLAESR